MSSQRHSRSSARLLTAVTVGALAFGAQPAASQSLFEFFFGGGRSLQLPQRVSSYANPRDISIPSSSESRPRSYGGGGSVAHCVRLCDGRHFPVQRHAGTTPAQLCAAFCPAAKTKVFSGSNIEYASASDGQRYSDLPSAFAYRTKVVADCTCNGKDAFGLAKIDVANDPTLRGGDVVATNSGFVAFSGRSSKVANFTPINRAAVSGEMRATLARTKIEPASKIEPGDGSPPTRTAEENPVPKRAGRSAQLER